MAALKPGDMGLKEVEEHIPIPRASMKAENAPCARRRVITASFTVPNYRNMFPEDLEPSLFPRKYASSVFPPPDTTQLVFTPFQETTRTGYAIRAKLTSCSVEIARNIRHPKIG